MQFRVPQFIDIEDKIFGPFTFKQFVYILGGLGLSYVIYKVLPLLLAIPVIIGVLILSALLTFYKVNNKPFISTLEPGLNFYLQRIFKQNLYIWRKAEPKKSQNIATVAESPSAYVPKLSDSKLKDISWSLDVLDVKK